MPYLQLSFRFSLYNAVLAAELEVVERMPHSMTISYVDLSRDAAIAGTYKDFKFKNNTDTPIVIESSTKNRKITFKIWGHEVRDTVNRKIDYVTKVISETKPPKDVITEDATQPTTYRKVTQTAHVGYRAELYKVVYENGVEVSRTLVNTSNYQAAPQYVTVGTKKPKEDNKDNTDKTGTTDTSDSGKTNNTTDTNNQTDNSTNSNSDNSGDQNSTQDEINTNEAGGWDPTWDLDVPLE
jgi:hypothetical protein